MDLDVIRSQFAAITPIPDSEWEAFVQLFTPQKYKAGDIIVRSGEVTKKFAFIESGLVRFFYITYEGKECNQTFKAEGDLISSYYSIITQKESPFAIEALEETVLFEADYTIFRTFLDRHTCWLKIMIYILEQNFIAKSEREMQFLLYLAPARYKKFCQDFAHLLSRITRYHQALYLGITPQALSRLGKNQKEF